MMKPATLYGILLFVLLLNIPSVYGQYTNITNTSGTVFVSNVFVTVTPLDGPGVFPSATCGINAPFWPGQSPFITVTNNAYRFSFSSPVTGVKLRVTTIDSGEIVAFYINGSHYNLTASNVSFMSSTCSNPLPVVIGGNLVDTVPGSHDAVVEITGMLIDSIRVHHLGNIFGYGTPFDFGFHAGINVALKQPINDTALCAGDTLHVPFTVNEPFLSGNVFTLELSDPMGSFASGTTALATITGIKDSIFKYVIPPSMTPSNNYRIRVTASAPVRYTLDNGHDIAIGVLVPGKPIASNSGPVCTGSTLQLNALSSTPGVAYRWAGPNGFGSSNPNPGISNVNTFYNGRYIVAARLYGCYSRDTTNAIVAGDGSLTHVPNFSICENDSLKLKATSSLPSSGYNWTGPNGFVSHTKDTVIVDVQPTLQTGKYVFTTTLLGICPAKDSFIVTVKAKVSNHTATSNGTICEGDTLKLFASSGVSGTIVYQWTGPGSYASTLKNAIRTSTVYTQSGNYIAGFSLANNGCWVYDTIPVIIKQGPAPLSASSNTPICQPDTLKLIAVNSSGAAYTWTGPAGFSASTVAPFIANPSIGAAGKYFVNAVFSNGCARKDSTTVVIKPTTNIHGASSNTPVCEGDTLLLSSSIALAGVSYSWKGPGLYSSNLQNPSTTNISSSAAGSYVVKYVLSNGCTLNDTTTVAVKSSPAAITAASNSPICEADTLKLNSTNSSSGVVWAWTGPNSFTSATQNDIILNVQLNAGGRYYVTATSSNGCYRMDSVDAIIKPLPANFAAGSNSPICQNVSLNLYASTTSSGVNFSWTGPNSFSSALQSPAISNAQPMHSGNYIVTATLNGCVVKDTQSVAVMAIPAKPTPSANTPVCGGQDLNLSSGSSGPAYLWTGPGGFTNSIQNPVRTSASTAMAGTYIVKALNGGCISDTASVLVSVIPGPAAGMYPSPSDSICTGSTVTFFTSVKNAGVGAAIRWFKNNSLITGATNVNYSTNTAQDLDLYYCTVTSNGTCALPFTDTSNAIQMRVFPWLAPSVSITANTAGTIKGGELITFTASPVNAGTFPTYQWKRNNKDVQGATSNIWGARTLDSNDLICAVITSGYICPQPKTANSNCITVSVDKTGVDYNGVMPGIKIYPNPVTSELVIEGLSEGMMIQIVDLLGRAIINTVATRQREMIDMHDLASGTYLLRLNNIEGSRMSAKVVKQ